MSKRQPIVSSISVAFRRALTPTEDVAKAKLEHRSALKELTDNYMERVRTGKAEGIRNAKDLVEVMKMDLLLLGEATERTDNNSLDEMRVTRVAEALDLDDPNIQAMINSVMGALNEVNDQADKNPAKPKPVVEEYPDEQVEDDGDEPTGVGE